jgi:hypothetical protein
MSSLLEERYRRVLRMLPAGFRRDWEDDMVATFLDRAYRSRPDDPEGVDISSPRWPEVASVARQAVRLRIGDGSGAGPREYVTGGALRRFALAGVLAHVALALSGVLLAVWWTTRLTGSEAGFTSWGRALLSLSGLLWIPAYAGLLSGRPRIAAVLGAVTLVPEVMSLPSQPNLSFGLAWLLAGVAPLPAMVAFHRGAPPVRGRPWLIAVPVLTAALVAVVLVTPPADISLVAITTVGVVMAGLGTLLTAGRLPAATAAAGLGCLVVLPLRLTDLNGATAIAQLAALVLVGGAAALMTRNGVGALDDVVQGWAEAAQD